MGKFSAYKVPLGRLSEGAHTYSYHLGKQFFSDMESADIHDADLQVEVVVDTRNDQYKMSMHVTGMVTLLCDRCLDALEWPVDQTYDITVKYGDDYDDSNDAVLVIPLTDTDLNIAYMLHDTVALSIPMRHVHPLGKCNRAMSQVLKLHTAQATADDLDAELEQGLIDEIDDMAADDTAATES